MLEMICNIPENVGWMLVGALGMCCVMALVSLGWVCVEAIKERIEENKFWKVHHCDEGEE